MAARRAGVSLPCSSMLASTAVLALAAWGAHRLLLGAAPATGLGRQALLCFGPIAAGGAAYLAAARLLRVEELGELWGALRRKRE